MFHRTLLQRLGIGLMLLCSSVTMIAQTKKNLTLDDLMWGGSNYWNLQPRSLQTTFWGNQLVGLTPEETFWVGDSKHPVKKVLFTIDDFKKVLKNDSLTNGLSLYHTIFPAAKAPVALLTAPGYRWLYDWQKKKILWSVKRERGTQDVDFNVPTKSEAFVKNHNLYLQTADGKVHQISKDGSHDLSYGTTVYRNEFGYNKGTFFSPSGKLLAFTRMDESMVKDYPQVNIFKREAEVEPDKYPMAGMKMHKVTLGIYNPATEKTVYLQTGDPTDRYFTNPSWSPDEQTIYLIELPRTQDKAELVAYDVKTGARKGVLYTETHPKYVHPMHGLTFLPWDASKFIYQSEKDGYNHLYLMDTKGNIVKQLTKGPWVVVELAGFDLKNKRVIVNTTASSPIRHNYYAVSVATGKMTPLDNGVGVHSGKLSADGSLLVDRWSSPKVFRAYDLINTDNLRQTRLQTDENPYKNYHQPDITCGTIKAADDTTTLYYRLVKPADFDPHKKYPTIVYVYGGPGVRNIEERWHYASRPWETYMAQKGYVLFILDNRGSSERGFKFESATFRHLGDEEMKDQMKGVDFLRTLPYVDTTRIGVHGWSFGGFMTTNLMLTHPEVFKVGVAGGPVIDWKYYEVMYGERYMDTPQENPEGYKNSSLLNKAQNLKGRLEIIIGYNDPVCVPQQALSFLRACEDKGTQPDFFLYPGQGHNMMGKDMVHLHERITRYFEDHLKPLHQQK